MSTRQHMDLFVKDIPIDVQRRFKALCSQRGIPMRRRLIELMRQDVQRGHRELTQALSEDPKNNDPIN